MKQLIGWRAEEKRSKNKQKLVRSSRKENEAQGGPSTLTTMPLDDFNEDRRPVLQGLSEDLQQVSVLIEVE